jgi:hypothetical protein
LFEISALVPQIQGALSGPVNLPGFPPATVSLGSTSLEFTGSPRLEIGYRLGDGLGAVAISYRSVVSKGGSNEPGFGGFSDAFLSSLLNMNVVDIDYLSSAFELAPFWDSSWRAGIRTAAVYYQNELTSTFGQQELTNNFIGAGPHAGVAVGRALDVVPGLGVLTQLDGALVVGNISQSFEESFQTHPVISGGSHSNHVETAPVLTFDIGLTYTPPCNFNWARFGLGYQFEYWWDVGTSGNSRGNLMMNSVYFRGEFNF